MGGVSGNCSRGWAIGLLSCLAFLLLSPVASGTAAAAAADDPFPLERLFDFGPEGTGAPGFESVDSIALDQQNELVYVLDRSGSAGSVLKFNPDGEPVDFEGTSSYIDGNRIDGLEPLAGPEGSTQIAVDSSSGLIYVTETDAIRAFEANGEPAEFTAGPGMGTSEIPGFSELVSIAVDAEGSIYASDSSGLISIFGVTGAPLTSFSAASPTSIDVDSSGAVYVQEGEQAISRFTPNLFPVTESTTYSEGPFVANVAPSLFRGFDIDASNNDVYVLETSFSTTWIQRYDVTAALVESFGAPGTSTEDSALEGTAEGIAVWEQGKEIAEGEAIKLYAGDAFRTRVAALGRKIVIGPPEIVSTSVSNVTADSAKLRARVDPNTSETTYHFEYGLEDCALPGSTCTSVPFPEAIVGAGEQPVEVSHSIVGLQPATTYYFRVVAKNALGPTVEGPSRTFRTQLMGVGFELPDLRVWEMVSPPDKHDALLRGTWGGLIQAASNGEGLAYLALGTIEPDSQGNRMPELSSIIAQRGPDGWRSQDISSPNNEAISLGLSTEGEFKLYNPDLSRGALMPRGSTLLSPEATERTPYLRQHGNPAAYTPLLTGREGIANVPPGTEFGGPPNLTLGAVIPIGATPDLSRILLQSSLDVPLVAGLPTPVPGKSIYLWTAGKLQPISLLPADEGGVLADEPSLGSGKTTVQNAISGDGSRVFWGRLAPNDGGTLFMRDTTAEQTVRLDVPQGGTGTGGATPVFQGASADGTVVFFTDSRQLTPDASPSGRDLYRCEIPAGSPAAGCANLTNLSVPLGSGESGEVLDLVSGLSSDGSGIYFPARGVLDDEPNSYGDSAVAGEPNLYHWEEGEEVRFIATLDDEDKGVWGMRGSINAAAGAIRAATVSPNGRFLVFMSQRSLTGYDNFEATSGKPVQEVFRYDAVTGDLTCLSCNPFGVAPRGEEPVGRPLINPGPIGEMYGGVQVAATLPAGYRNEEGLPLYHARTALDNGRVFFNAFDSLVPADSNGEWDVYQWEPIGVGSCSASSGDAGTARSGGGCVSLLSSGTAERESGFFDASVSGDDVFFLTPARLSVMDVDDAPDVYDARVGGVEATLRPTPECQGEACRPPVVPPGDLSPGSATFQGPGNVKPNKGKRCPKGKRKVRSKGKVRCVRKNRQNQKRASQDRRAVR
jgi:hypothetical protein